MASCIKCGSNDTRAYDSKPPINGGRGHTCTPECRQTGIFCRSCHFLQPRNKVRNDE